jgi:phospholipase C
VVACGGAFGGLSSVKRLLLLLQLSMIVALPGCAQQQEAMRAAPLVRAPLLQGAFDPATSEIQHVVIIFQENRSTDNLFNGLPGADTVKYGQNSKGRRIPLQPILLTAPYDMSHRHSAFLVEYAKGKLNGFNLDPSHCNQRSQCPAKGLRSYAFVPRYEVEQYFTMAEQYAFADRMFQTNAGPSFPSHQYILSGTSTISEGSSLRAAENPKTPTGKFTGGCNSHPGTLVSLIDPNGNENQTMFPCFDRPALTDLLDAKSLSWHYYQASLGPGLWNGPDAIRHLRHSPEYHADVVAPPSQVLRDIANASLASVAWVTPTYAASDHAGNTDGSGPSWVASVVNAIGKSQYWNSTAIFVTWDDWGGWYDHVKPPQYNSYELGFRVPLIVISPYTSQGYVSHKQHEFGSILKFVEETFGLGSLGTTDVRSDDLSDFFDFTKAPRPFVPISAPRDANYFLHQPVSTEAPDNDF